MCVSNLVLVKFRKLQVLIIQWTFHHTRTFAPVMFIVHATLSLNPWPSLRAVRWNSPLDYFLSALDPGKGTYLSAYRPPDKVVSHLRNLSISLYKIRYFHESLAASPKKLESDISKIVIFAMKNTCFSDDTSCLKILRVRFRDSGSNADRRSGFVISDHLN